MWILDSRCRTEREATARDLIADGAYCVDRAATAPTSPALQVLAPQAFAAKVSGPITAAPLFSSTAMTVRPARASVREAGP